MMNNKAHTLTELLIAAVIIVILFASCLGAFVLTKAVSQAGLAEEALQRDVNTLMARIIKGMREGTEVFGLRSAQSYTIPAVGRIDFVGTDDNTRRYMLNNNTIIYASPAQSPNQRTIYTPPPNSNIILRFWNPYAGQPNNDNTTVGIYLSVLQQTSGRVLSGSSSTFLNLKNMPK